MNSNAFIEDEDITDPDTRKFTDTIVRYCQGFTRIFNHSFAMSIAPLDECEIRYLYCVEDIQQMIANAEELYRILEPPKRDVRLLQILQDELLGMLKRPELYIYDAERVKRGLCPWCETPLAELLGRGTAPIPRYYCRRCQHAVRNAYADAIEEFRCGLD